MNEAERELCEQLQAEIEAEIAERDKKFRKKIILICLVLLILPIMAHRKYISYRLKYFITKPTETVQNVVNIYQKPELTLFDTQMTRIARSDDLLTYDSQYKNKLINLFDFNSNEFINLLDEKNKVKYKLLPMATFSISGRLVATNSLFSSNMDTFDATAIIDMGILWGKCAGDADWLAKNYQFKSKKYINGRVLTTTIKDKEHFDNKCTITNEEIQHLHIIPGSKNIHGILLKQKPYTPIKIEGLLVDIFTAKEHIKGSLNIDDINEESRSGGACKVILVSKVQIGDKIYK